MMSKQDAGLKMQDSRRTQNTKRKSLESKVLGFGSRAFLVLLVLFISLSNNGPTYGTMERERRDMNQQARAALEKILSTEQFQNRDIQSSWWSRILERFFNRLPRGAGWLNTMLEWLLYLIAALVIVSVFVFIAKRFRRLPSFTANHDAITESQRYMDPEAMRTQAYECSQKGDYKQAIRYLYLSLLLCLDKAGLLTYGAGRTNGEYVDEVHSSMDEGVERFASLTLLFERKWYGMEESSAGDFRQCEEIFIGLTDS